MRSPAQIREILRCASTIQHLDHVLAFGELSKLPQNAQVVTELQSLERMAYHTGKKSSSFTPSPQLEKVLS